MPVWARPRISAWISCVPSWVSTVTKKGAEAPFLRRLSAGGSDLFPCRASCRIAAGTTAEADLFGKLGTLLGIFGRDHWVIRLQPPFRPVFIGRQIVCRAQMPLQHLELFAVFETDQIFRR